MPRSVTIGGGGFWGGGLSEVIIAHRC